MGGLILILWAYIYRTGFKLSTPYNLEVTALIFLGGISTFIKLGRRFSSQIYFSILVIAYIQQIYLCEVNNMDPFLISGMVLAVSIGILSIYEPKYFFYIIMIPNLYFLTSLLRDSTQNRQLMVVSVFTVSIVNFYFVYHRYLLLENSKRDQLLIQTQKAQALTRVKMLALGEMAGAMAHEINNPLSIIAGKSQILLKRIELGDSGEALNEPIKQIISTTNRIEKIIKSLRNIAKDASDLPLEKTSVNSLIEESLGLCQSQLISKGIKISTVYLNKDILIDCRSAQIIQVLLSLLSNARDAIENLTEPWIKINIEVQGSYAMFHIIDSGSGISAEIEEKIFQPFFTTKTVGVGTGLGLSVSRGIAEEHRGFLRINHSSPHTEFVLGLPI